MDECCVTCENERSNSWSGSSKSLFFTASRERGTAAMPPLRRGAPPAHNSSSRVIRPPKSDSGRLKLSAREPTATRAEKRPVVNQGGAGNDRGRTTRREELRGLRRRTCGGCQEFLLPTSRLATTRCVCISWVSKVLPFGRNRGLSTTVSTNKW